MRALAALALLCLAGCGFQLRGTASLPFETLYMRPTATPGVALDLKRNILSGTHTALVDDPKKADAILELTPDIREKVILSLAATGRVREYQLRYRVSFRVHDGKGADFIPMTAVPASVSSARSRRTRWKVLMTATNTSTPVAMISTRPRTTLIPRVSGRKRITA
jgi:outer membrane lipopolysaccharide assembly protein LptE/RlpB